MKNHFHQIYQFEIIGNIFNSAWSIFFLIIWKLLKFSCNFPVEKCYCIFFEVISWLTWPLRFLLWDVAMSKSTYWLSDSEAIGSAEVKTVVCLFVCFFVCLFVNTITQERVEMQLHALKPDGLS